MDRQSEVKYFEYGDGMIEKVCVFCQFLQIYVCFILIFKQQGQILKAHEIIGRPTKDPKSVVPKRPTSLVWQVQPAPPQGDGPQQVIVSNQL